jgi:hypothetical protein
MAQRASRARRLSKLLVELHDISDSWPKWQSRMFREGVMECASECSSRRESRRSLNASKYRYHPADITDAGKICNDELENTTKSFEAQPPDSEDASAYPSASAAVLTRTNSGSGSGSKNDRTGNPLAQLGYLPDHLESAIQNEVCGVKAGENYAAPANISKGNAYMVVVYGARRLPRAVLRSRIIRSHGATCRLSARSVISDRARRHVHACVGCD